MIGLILICKLSYNVYSSEEISSSSSSEFCMIRIIRGTGFVIRFAVIEDLRCWNLTGASGLGPLTYHANSLATIPRAFDRLDNVTG